jgi:hypothetical protein
LVEALESEWLDAHSIPSTSDGHSIWLDCYNTSVNRSCLRIQNKSFRVYFVYDTQIKKNLSFHGAIFFNHSAYSNAPFRYPKPKRFCVLSESPVHQVFINERRVRRIFNRCVTHNKYLCNSFPDFYCFQPFGTSYLNPSISLPDAKVRLLSFVGSITHGDEGGYRLRKSIASFCSDHVAFCECFGRGINEIKSKEDALMPYCFSIAMENDISDCYYTEKLIDCFLAGTIPIYWGTKAVSRYFDDEGILFFDNLDDLKQILLSLSTERYKSLQHIAARNRQLAIDMRLYSYEAFMLRIAETIHPYLDNVRVGGAVRTKVIAATRKILGR